MEKLNSYLGLAENDYLYAKNSMDICEQLGNYNNMTVGCSQSAEKYFKAVIEFVFAEDEDSLDLLRSHNLRALYNKVIEKCEFNVSSRDCKWLGDFYFDARYPGDNFLVTTREDAEEAVKILESIRESAVTAIEAEKKVREEQREAVQELKAFAEDLQRQKEDDKEEEMS